MWMQTAYQCKQAGVDAPAAQGVCAVVLLCPLCNRSRHVQPRRSIGSGTLACRRRRHCIAGHIECHALQLIAVDLEGRTAARGHGQPARKLASLRP